MRRFIMLTSLVGLAFMAASPAMAQDTPTATVSVEDQEGDGTTVTVPEATIEGSSGWVAIHLDDGGMPLVPQTEGETYIEEGTTGDVTVELDTPVDSSQTLYAMIHTDNPDDEAYNFPQTATEDMPEDPPVMGDGGVVVEPFEYEVVDTATSGAGVEGQPLPDTGGPELTLLAGSAMLLLVGGAAMLAVRSRRA